MKRATLLATLALGMLAASLPAAAQKTSPPRSPEPSASYSQKPTVLEIEEGSTVTGGVATPDGFLIVGSKAARHPSLIKVRANFHAEAIKTAEGI